jgi:hypothetical protein
MIRAAMQELEQHAPHFDTLFRRSGVRGIIRRPDECPVARWLRKRVFSDDIRILVDCRPGEMSAEIVAQSSQSRELLSQPTILHNWIKRFDAGEFPDLIDSV